MKTKLDELKRKNLFREFRTVMSSCSATVKFRGKEFIMLASNNYFGLNTNPRVISAAKKAIDKYGTGNEASRLIVNLDIHQKLEFEIAKYKKCESAILYSSGYAANVGIISSVVGKGDFILSDELNHASIIDGCRLSKAEVQVYRHCNVHHLEKTLKLISIKKENKKNKVMVVTDSIFSMDGDIAPLKKIIELKKKYNFILMVDDAHSIGVVDTNFKEIDIHMGTLSKALGSQGGYCAGSKELIEHLRNFSRSFMYSTGVSPPDTAAALESLRILKSNMELKKNLLKNYTYLREKLLDFGFEALGEYQIIPIIINDNNKTMQFQKMLEDEGIFVTGIRQPTVKNSRLRVSAMATHTKKQLDLALDAFEKVGKKLKVI